MLLSIETLILLRFQKLEVLTSIVQAWLLQDARTSVRSAIRPIGATSH